MLKIYNKTKRPWRIPCWGIAMLIFLTSFMPGRVLSQDLKLITGTVTEANGAPLPGVSVKVKGTQKATSTSNAGKYNIQAKSTDVLVFSFVGSETQEVTVGARTTINVKLADDAKSLDETVIIGYQTVKKTDLTGAIGQVKMSDLNKAPVSSFAEALAGRVSGVQVSSGDGQPGSNMSIMIRGAASINNSTQPLYVIDGFATEAVESTSLNPDDIESITILKDAAATSVYGSRATNGVVVIQTKSGKVGKPVISYNSSYGAQIVAKEIDLMSPYEFVKYQFERNPTDAAANYLTNGKTLESYKNDKGIYWPGQILRTGSVFINNIAVRGGSENTKYAISGGGFDQKGVLINTGYKRYQGRAKLDQTISNKLKVGISADYMDVSAFGVQASSIPTGGGASSAIWFRTWVYRPTGGSATTYDILNEDGDPESINSSDIRLNPRVTAENEYSYNTYVNFNANAYLTYNVTKDLILKVTGVKNALRRGQDRFYNSKTPQASPLNPLATQGIFGSVLQSFADTWSNENTLTYNKLFNDTHSLTVIGGNSQTSYKSKSNGFTSTFLPEESQGMAGLNEGTVTAPVATASSNTLSSFFGIVDYNYKSKYYLKAGLRADGSSKFSQRWGYFPSGAIAWNMHKEDFMKDLTFISNSKLRLSYGVTGNNRIGDFDWYAKLELDAGAGYSYNNSPNIGAYISGVENRNLKWEKTESSDIGYELGLFDNKIELTVDAYRRTTKDLLITNAPIAAHTGFATATKNIGSLRNQGLEFGLNTVNIKTRSFTWESSFNITFNKNKIIALNRDQGFIQTTPSFETAFTDMYLSEVGQPLGMMYGYVWDGNYQYADFDNPSPGTYILKPSVPTNGASVIQPGDIKYKDLNGDGTVNSLDRTIIGRGQPIHFGGFSNNFGYKNFSLNVFLQWSYGNDIYNANRLILEGNANGRTDLNQFASYIDRWSPTNQNSKNYRAGGHGQVGYHSSRVVEDGSYLRLKTVSLAYALPAKYIKRLFLSSLSLNVSAQNLFVLTKYTGIDPEVSTRGPFSVLSPGFDYSPYPQARTIVVGLNAAF
ncbi:SusC/RagA family TonB-linked outer membrane protein [Pedobacter heparinus]|nr:TonB-dependent receptor [Pedobacter heparinus]